MKNLKFVASSLLIGIAVIHVGISFFEYESMSTDALWFISGGLFIASVGIFNLFILQNASGLQHVYLLTIVNIALSVFLILMVIQLPMIPGFIALLCSVYLTLFNHAK